MADIEVWGHRGAAATHPENTLPAFAAAIDAGAEGIEFDVGLSADGVAVVIHDDTVDRTTDGRGRVRDLALARLQGFDAGAGASIPTLDDVLALAVGRTATNIEIKDPDAVGAVLEAIARHPRLDWFVSSFSGEALRALRTAAPTARIYSMALAGPLDTVASGLAFAAEVGAEGLSVRASRLGERDVARIHSAGLSVWAWTVNDPERAAELAGCGVDAVCTDDPVTMLTARDALG